MKYFIFSIKILTIALAIYFLFPILNTKYQIPNTSASAQTMSNGSYIIQMGNLNSIAGRPTGSGFKLLYTAGQTSPGLYSGGNYKVKSGFEYVLSKIPFRFSISSIFIDFGTVTAGNPVYRSNQLTVSNGSAFGYQVTVSQNHNLRNNPYGAEIPATICDSGHTCSTTTANQWQTPIAFGFGYNCTNVTGSTDCAPDFSSSIYYRPFVASPSAAVVMSSPNVGRNKQATITYQLNVSNTQVAGLYNNVLNYIAMPTF
jgi:hypothetical protein